MSDLPAAGANAALNAILTPSTTYYLSLHTGDPGTTGANEVSGGSYVRQAITMGSASGSSQASTNSQAFTGMPSASITKFGIWSASTSGTFESGGDLGGTTVVPVGATVNFAIGAIVNSVS